MAGQVINWESKPSSQQTRLEVSNSSHVKWQYEENSSDFGEAHVVTYGLLNGINAQHHVDLCGRFMAYLQPLPQANGIPADEKELRLAVLSDAETIKDLGVCSVPGEKVLALKLFMAENPHILVHFEKSVTIFKLFENQSAHFKDKSFSSWVNSILTSDAEFQSPLGMVIVVDLKFTSETAPLEVYWHPQENWEFITCHRGFAAQWAVKNLVHAGLSKKFAADSDFSMFAQAAPYNILFRLIKAICNTTTQKEPKCAMTAVGDNALLFLLMNPNFLGVYADDATHDIGRPHLKGFVELDHEWFKSVVLTGVVAASKPIAVDKTPVSATALLNGANMKKITKSLVPKSDHGTALNMAITYEKDKEHGIIFFRVMLPGLANEANSWNKSDTLASPDRSKEDIWVSEPLLNLALGERESSSINYMDGTFIISVAPGADKSVPALITVHLGNSVHKLCNTTVGCEIVKMDRIPADNMSSNLDPQLMFNIAGRISQNTAANVVSQHLFQKAQQIITADNASMVWVRVLSLPSETGESAVNARKTEGRPSPIVSLLTREKESSNPEAAVEEPSQLDLSTPSESPANTDLQGRTELLPPGFSGRMRPPATSDSPNNPFSSRPTQYADGVGNDQTVTKATVETLASLLADRLGARILALADSKRAQMADAIVPPGDGLSADSLTYTLSEGDKNDLSRRFVTAAKPIQTDLELTVKGLLSSATFMNAHNKLEAHLEQTMQQVVKVSMQSLTSYMKSFVKESIIPSFINTIDEALNDRMEQLRKEVMELSQNEKPWRIENHADEIAPHRKRSNSQGNGNAASDITTTAFDDLRGQIESLKEDLFVAHAKQLATVQAETIQRVQAYILTHVTKPFTAKLDDLKEDIESQLAALATDASGEVLGKNIKYHDRESIENILIDIRTQMKRQSQSLMSTFSSATQRLADKITVLKAETGSLKGMLSGDEKGVPSQIFPYDPTTGLASKRARNPAQPTTHGGEAVYNGSGGPGASCLPASSSLIGEDTQCVRCADCAGSFRHDFHCSHETMALQPACSVPLTGQYQSGPKRPLNQPQPMRLRPRSVYRGGQISPGAQYCMGNRETDWLDDGSIVSRRPGLAALGGSSGGNGTKWISDDREMGLDAQLSRINLSHIATASPDDSGDGAFAEDLLNKIAEEQYDVCMYRAAQRDTEEGTDGFWTLLSSRHFEPVAVGLRRGGAILVGAAKLIVDGLLIAVGTNGSYLSSGSESKNVTVAISNGITMNIPKACIVANPDTIVARLNWLRSVLAIVDVNQANLEPSELMEYRKHLEQGLIRFWRAFPASGRMAGWRGLVQRHVHSLVELLNGKFGGGGYGSGHQTAGAGGHWDPPSIVF